MDEQVTNPSNNVIKSKNLIEGFYDLQIALQKEFINLNNTFYEKFSELNNFLTEIKNKEGISESTKNEIINSFPKGEQFNTVLKTIKENGESANAIFETIKANGESANAIFETIKANGESANAIFETIKANGDSTNAIFETIKANGDSSNAIFETIKANGDSTNAIFETIKANGDSTNAIFETIKANGDSTNAIFETIKANGESTNAIFETIKANGESTNAIFETIKENGGLLTNEFFLNTTETNELLKNEIIDSFPDLENFKHSILESIVNKKCFEFKDIKDIIIDPIILQCKENDQELNNYINNTITSLSDTCFGKINDSPNLNDTLNTFFNNFLEKSTNFLKNDNDCKTGTIINKFQSMLSEFKSGMELIPSDNLDDQSNFTDHLNSQSLNNKYIYKFYDLFTSSDQIINLISFIIIIIIVISQIIIIIKTFKKNK